MQHIVLDTNVIISAIVFGGVSREVLDLAIQQKVRLCISDPILDELQGVLRRTKFGYSSEQIRLISRNILSVSDLIETTQEVDVIKSDPADNAILDCAWSGNASFIVSGDNHLLRLKEFEGIKLVSPRQFLELENYM